VLNIILVLIFLTVSGFYEAENDFYPAEHWMQYKNPQDAGFSVEKLSQLRQKYNDFGGSALLIIHDGKVLLSAGQTTRRFRQHSIRKSYLNALLGIAVNEGKIDTAKTLSQLKIDDMQPLSEKEKKARVIDLMRARSGIYLPSAFSTGTMEKNLPERGSFKPGQHWFYNNWDFNVMGYIYNLAMPGDIFSDFRKQITEPLGFEDFDSLATHYLYEKDKSFYPAYLFRLSARDMARFGLLYLRNGHWAGKQVIPESWIKISTQPYSKKIFGEDDMHYGYGLMWWTYKDLHGEFMYGAFGAGGQRISVFPESKLVLVHLTDTYRNREVSDDQINHLCSMLLDARTGPPDANAELVTYKPARESFKTITVAYNDLKMFEGVYHSKFLGEFKIAISNMNYLLLTSGIGRFRLFPVAKNTFISREIAIPMIFMESGKDNKMSFQPVMNDKKEIENFRFYY